MITMLFSLKKIVARTLSMCVPAQTLFVPVFVRAGLINPIAPTNTIQQFLLGVLQVLIEIGFPVAVLFVVYSGFLFVTARGDREQLTRAKKAFFWTVIGSAILLGALALSQVIEATITAL